MARLSVWMGTTLFVFGVVGVVLSWQSSLNWTFITVGLFMWVTALVSRRLGPKPPVT
jgi:multisubunit Na+/H+ antiporter MnhG subunit